MKFTNDTKLGRVTKTSEDRNIMQRPQGEIQAENNKMSHNLKKKSITIHQNQNSMNQYERKSTKVVMLGDSQ